MKQESQAKQETPKVNIDNGVGIGNTYTSSNPYVCPADGYLLHNSWGSYKAKITFVTLNNVSMEWNPKAGEQSWFFCKKGMKFYATKESDTALQVVFYTTKEYTE